MSVVILLTLGVIGFLGYKTFIFFNIRSEKAAFKKIEKDIDNLIVKMEEANPTVITQKEMYCARDEEKFGGGQLRCQVRISFKIIKSDSGKAIEDIGRLISTKDFETLSSLKDEQGFSEGQYTHSPSKSTCFSNYKISNDSENAEIRFYCIRKEYKAIFPML